MTLEVYVGQSALDESGTGTDDLTSPDSTTTPVGVLHCLSRGEINGTSRNSFDLAIGMADGTIERSISTTANNEQASDDATRGLSASVITQTQPGAQIEQGESTHNSFIAGGERVNNTNGYVFAHLCSHMFFAGCNLAVEEVVLNATVDTLVNVDPGFAWDVVLVMDVRQTAVGLANDNQGSFGFYVKADDAFGCIITDTANGAGSPGGPGLIISTTYAGGATAPGLGTIVYGIDIAAAAGNSADIIPRVAGGESNLIQLMFIGFTTGESAKIVQWDSPTGLGDNIVTGAGGTPIALIHLLSRAAAYNVAEADADAGVYGISFITPDSQFCVSAANEFATGANSDTQGMADNKSIRVPIHNGTESVTTSFEATLVSMLSNGWKDNWTSRDSGTARKQLSLAFLPLPIVNIGAHIKQRLFAT